MDIIYGFLYFTAGLIVVALISLIIYSVLKSPFKYPYCVIELDVTGKRAPNVDDAVDNYLKTCGFGQISKHNDKVDKWKKHCLKRIKNSNLQKLRARQFEKATDDGNMFCFELVRKQTRYRQENYVKSPYSVNVPVAKYAYGFDALKQRFDELTKINFECTLSEYRSKEQRKLMTAALREEIARRDNYTCQICGKYMPDGVGLHIDHIVPIKKGGKTLSSNLQVLCSKCNGRKSGN